MPKITVYTRPACPPCKMVKQFLEENNVPFEAKDVEEKAEYEQELLDLGFMKTPIVVVEGQDPIVGFDKDRLDELIGE
jgi:glutaredoxin